MPQKIMPFNPGLPYLNPCPSFSLKPRGRVQESFYDESIRAGNFLPALWLTLAEFWGWAGKGGLSAGLGTEEIIAWSIDCI